MGYTLAEEKEIATSNPNPRTRDLVERHKEVHRNSMTMANASLSGPLTPTALHTNISLVVGKFKGGHKQKLTHSRSRL